jgi:hypothetical protein
MEGRERMRRAELVDSTSPVTFAPTVVVSVVRAVVLAAIEGFAEIPMVLLLMLTAGQAVAPVLLAQPPWHNQHLAASEAVELFPSQL